ncbi:efflux RND transporter periplasmic adaptor subunit [Patescibacteria group bacterium]|nr:efflux RND transporter periplasmic adaptor subunit [Patescibacteria group bacterium]MDE1946852.1 efflux RND transporter periplasmic adaptor subunit [Patescibacteria group bacterium]MDE2010672.1 efflux RND transporter periplasmic adaptor subunit [Patescibacteria group bacterium]MDE2232722.1 efflux RND transporter periplasmic adaptor subunit [Patescibacteria group bacterium]
MKIFKRFRLRTYVIAGIIILVIVFIAVASRGSSVSNIESAAVTRGNIVEQVSVTGKVSPIDKADLAFEKSGVISKIFVKVGDSVKAGDKIAALDSAGDLANLQSAQAKLDDMTRTLRPEELSAEQAKVDSAKTALDNAKTDALNAARDGYVETEGAVVNYADAFFTNPQSANPTIKVTTQSQTQENSIDAERVAVTDELAAWQADLAAATSTDRAAYYLSRAHGHLSMIKNFMNDLSGIANYLSPGNSGLVQSAIDAYVGAMNSAQSALNQAISSVTTAEAELQNASAAYDEARSNFILKNAGSSPEAIAAQQASVAYYQSALDNDVLVSPIDGLVTRVDPSDGEFVSAGQSAFSVQSYGDYKVEAYVPEADIAKVALNNTAAITLDAYGPDVNFPAVVTAIDPAETVLEGVPTYKVTMHFTQKDDRVRSGMTANTEILTHEHDNVLTIPTRAVVDNSGQKSVRVLDADGKTYRSVPVVAGLKGSDGMTEIISGLTEGQKVVTYVK